MEQHIIYNVDKEEYESCSIRRRNPSAGRLRLKQVIGNPTERLAPARSLIKNMSVNRKTKIKQAIGSPTERLPPEIRLIKKNVPQQQYQKWNRWSEAQQKDFHQKTLTASLTAESSLIKKKSLGTKTKTQTGNRKPDRKARPSTESH